MPPVKDGFMFEPAASPPIDALVIVFDLEGFSRFFAQPDVHVYVPGFLNKVFQAIRIVFHGGIPFWRSWPQTSNGTEIPDKRNPT